MSPTPALYNSAKLCKPFKYMECKINKWDCREGLLLFGECEEGIDSGRFQRRKVRVACLDGEEIEREWGVIMMRIIAGVQEIERAKERVAILLNDVWHIAVVDFGCVSSRMLWIKSKFSRVKVCAVVGYSPNEGDGEERERFWNDMDRTLDSVENGYRLCIIEDLNGWIGERMRVGITGAFGVTGENDNGRRVVEFCAERGLCGGITYFKYGNLHKYTRVARGQDGVEVKIMIDLVMMKSDMCRMREEWDETSQTTMLYCVK